MRRRTDVRAGCALLLLALALAGCADGPRECDATLLHAAYLYAGGRVTLQPAGAQVVVLADSFTQTPAILWARVRLEGEATARLIPLRVAGEWYVRVDGCW